MYIQKFYSHSPCQYYGVEQLSRGVSAELLRSVWEEFIEPSRVLGTLNAMGVDIETIKEGDGGIPAFFNVH